MTPTYSMDYLLMPLPRSGSNLMYEMLSSLECGRPYETWGDDLKDKRTMQWGETPRKAHAAYVRGKCECGGITGVKLQPHRVIRALGAGIEIKPRLVVAMLRPPLNCAVSLIKARRTGLWSIKSPEQRRGSGKLDLKILHKECRCIVDDFRQSMESLRGRRIMRIEYDDLAADPAKMARKVYQAIVGQAPTREPKWERIKQRTKAEEEFCRKHAAEFRHYYEELTRLF